VTLFSADAPDGLPDEVEVLPMDLLAEAGTWADYLAACLTRGNLADLRRLAGLRPHQGFLPGAEGLILTPMPCAGMAECGACAVRTTHGWKQACSDGPVFELNLLELE
jgi:hypothetical protein